MDLLLRIYEMSKLLKHQYNLDMNLNSCGNIFTAQHASCKGLTRKDMVGWGSNIQPAFTIKLKFYDGVVKDNKNVDADLNLEQAKDLVKHLNSFIRQCEKENAGG